MPAKNELIRLKADTASRLRSVDISRYHLADTDPTAIMKKRKTAIS